MGGLEEVLRRVTGHGTVEVSAQLSVPQKKALVARIALGDFRTVWDVEAWVEARWELVTATRV